MNHFISLSLAETMTERYRINRNDILQAAYQNNNFFQDGSNHYFAFVVN
jgi:hypothetical protein